MVDDEKVVRIDDLDAEVCWKLLARTPVGRVGFVVRDEPVVLPVNHVVDGHTVVVRTGQTDLLDALGGGAAAAFEVDGTDAFSETGWSVLVKGYAKEVTDPAERSEVERLPLHPWATGRKDHWIRIVPWSVTGRAISRRRATPEGQILPYMPAD
jgi:nitroimidazol reductase NimA-like FMN-containing flavoprotein (pyridoxamine 5'-phosphate oxidase superfamily)